MKEFLKELFEYSHYYNQKLAQVFTERPDATSEKSIQLFSHILNAHHIWNSRIEGIKPSFAVWDVQVPAALANIDDSNYQKSLELLEKSDLSEVLSYSNSKGQPFSNSVRDILFHVINHSTYHRAQIATEFKEHGLTPITTDFVHYKR